MLATRDDQTRERDAVRASPRPPRHDAPLALEARGVSKSFRPARGGEAVCAVDGVSLALRRGEIYGLLGTNGSGKSTLIRVFSTLLRADGGEVRIFGLDVRTDEHAARRLVDHVSVEASFVPERSALEDLVDAGRLHGLAGSMARDRAREILARLGLAGDRLNEPLEGLSRGMRRKVAMARAFLTSPVLLLLDEPTVGLDIRSKREVQALVRDLRDQHDATVLLATHDLDEAARLADRVGVIDGGRLVAEGEVPELLARSGARDLEGAFMALTGRRPEVPGGGEEPGMATEATPAD